MAKKKAKEKSEQKDAEAKLQTIRSELNGIYLERQDVIDGVLVAILAGVHMALLGPRGTGKTSLLKKLTRNIVGARLFATLLSKFNEPNDLFGPMDLAKFKGGEYRRKVDGMAPDSHFIYFDEVFKANGSILNAMLDLLQDREFNNGGEQVDCPLISCFGSSNELPSAIGDDMDPLWDRFMIRFWVDDIRDQDNMKAVMMAGGDTDDLSVGLTLQEIYDLQEKADDVDVSEELVDVMLKLRDPVAKVGVSVSTRRWVACIPVLRAHAFLNGRAEVNEDDLLFLQHLLWDEPNQRGKIAGVVGKVANPLAHAAQQVLDAQIEIFRKLPLDRESIPQSETAAVFTQAVDANGAMQQAIDKLRKMANGKRSAAIEGAITKLQGMQKEVGQFANRVSGFTL